MDERQDSIRQGIGVPPESQVGREAERQKQRRNDQAPPIGGGMGGTSDAETAPEESQLNRALSEIPAARGDTALPRHEHG
jgi:hypothetical protein